MVCDLEIVDSENLVVIVGRNWLAPEKEVHGHRNLCTQSEMDENTTWMSHENEVVINALNELHNSSSSRLRTVANVNRVDDQVGREELIEIISNHLCLRLCDCDEQNDEQTVEARCSQLLRAFERKN